MLGSVWWCKLRVVMLGWLGNFGLGRAGFDCRRAAKEMCLGCALV